MVYAYIAVKVHSIPMGWEDRVRTYNKIFGKRKPGEIENESLSIPTATPSFKWLWFWRGLR